MLDPDDARRLEDAHGVTLERCLEDAGFDPAQLGPDDARRSGIRAFVEVHVEQGRRLAELGAPLGVASGIWPHGRYRFELHGEANHAGTTPVASRRDPIVGFARAALAAREAALRHGGLATFGRLFVEPNSTNSIPSLVRAWLDARAAEESSVQAIVREVAAAAGTEPATESWTAAVSFDRALHDRLVTMLDAPSISTAAGHDAAVLAAAGVPAAMLFVRNETGISHSPKEHADQADCLEAVAALASTIAYLA
jgi:N-carbamoyl-L-amino-acid hydrolase